MEIINRNIKKKDISQRIGLTILLIILSRLGTFIPIPGVDHDAFYQSIATNPIVSFLNVFSGYYATGYNFNTEFRKITKRRRRSW
jgi:preprotein translocase subunit SecY